MADITTLLSTITNGALTGQLTTAQILRDENQRLIDKDKSMIAAKFGQQRIIDLNRSHSKKTAAYTKVMVFAAVALGIILLLRLFGGSFIPEPIFALIYIILISASILYGLFTYADVNAREPTNYDRLNIPPPVATPSEADKAKALATAKASGDLMGLSSGVCAGQACCSYDQAYDSSLNKCKKCDGGTSGYFSTTTNACALCNSGQTWKVGTATSETTTYACRA
jgi:hypothetical protein